MNDIEFIKKSVPFADGFEYVIDQEKDEYIKETITSIRMFCCVESFKDFNMYPILYSLFLTKVIEGIEMLYVKDGYYFERIYKSKTWIINVYNNGRLQKSVSNIEIDTAKRSAIEHVLSHL